MRPPVFPRGRLLNAAGSVEVFAQANVFGGCFPVRMFSPDGVDVLATAGARLGVDVTIMAVDRVTDVVVAGGPRRANPVVDEVRLGRTHLSDARSPYTASTAWASAPAAARLLDGRPAPPH
ncbi:hypothetical protein ABZS81_25000 [Streptomyces sp. NPDC005318]|uniref:hypothetical protein n=1 Tax=Streptomyces sp. NPDC005318 TaxID=3157031 RepID=UPI0033BFA617